jgi:hypothetical protein
MMGCCGLAHSPKRRVSVAKFLYVYYGGASGTTPKEIEKSTMEWMEWFKTMGRGLVDAGAPTMPGKTVSSTGVRATGSAGMVTGYTVVSAASMDEAAKMAKDAPGIDEGMKVAIYPLVEMMGPKK